MAVVFVVVLFLSKNETVYKNAYQENGLVYNGNEKVGDLVSRDTDLDGVSDWQEGLFGTDPTKKDTNDDGVPDNVEIARMSGQMPQNGELNLNNLQTEENLTETDQLSREIFSTIATLTQTGVIDQATIDKLSESLSSKMQSSDLEKVFTVKDLKVLDTDTLVDMKNYNNTLNNIFTKYRGGTTVIDVLDKFIIDEDNTDESALLELDQIFRQLNGLIGEASKVNVPASMVPFHLDVLNSLQKVMVNVNGIKFYNTDVLIAISAISQYSENAVAVEKAIMRLDLAIDQRLKQ